MAEPSLSQSAAPRSVVQPLSRAAERPCARPSCPAPARATLRFAYAAREASLVRLTEVADPQAYDLCVTHAGRTEPPRGWTLSDRRPDEDRVAAETPPAGGRDLGGEATVAVLAAALRSVPEVPAAAAPTAVPDPPSAEPVETPAPRPVPAAGDRRPRSSPAPGRTATDW